MKGVIEQKQNITYLKQTKIGDMARKIIFARLNNPCATMSEIASKMGISRQAVEQVLIKHNLSTRRFRQGYICNQCGREYTPKYSNSIYFCSKECSSLWKKSTLICSYCKRPFLRNSKLIISQISNNHNKSLFFCSKKCQGYWLGSQNIKYDWETAKVSYLGGKKPKRISKELNIPIRTLYAKIWKDEWNHIK